MINPCRAKASRDSQLPRANTKPLLPLHRVNCKCMQLVTLPSLCCSLRKEAHDWDIHVRFCSGNKYALQVRLGPGTVLGASDWAVTAWTSRPCSGSSHSRERPQITKKPRRKMCTHFPWWRVAEAGLEESGWGCSTQGRWSTSQGKLSVVPLDFLLVQVYWLLAHIWHDDDPPPWGQDLICHFSTELSTNMRDVANVNCALNVRGQLSTMHTVIFRGYDLGNKSEAGEEAEATSLLESPWVSRQERQDLNPSGLIRKPTHWALLQTAHPHHREAFRNPQFFINEEVKAFVGEMMQTIIHGFANRS